jgi:uncharacterized protein (TIGR03083 family)
VWIVVMVSQLGPAIDVRSTFRHERDLLIQLLRKLDEPEWAVDTVCPGWSVRDVAAHLLHDDLRRLSRSRDHVDGPVPNAGESLPTFLNRANDRWVDETRFLSPRLLVDLLTQTAHLLHRMWADVDLDQLGEGVWWAGVEVAPVWLDVARDYSEDWIHQQQIRDAIERPGLSSPEFLDPLLDTLMRALPKTYESLHAEAGATVVVVLHDGDRSLSWSLVTEIGRGWTVHPGTQSLIPTAQVFLPADIFWRLATGSVPRQQAVERSRLTGDERLAARLYEVVSVVR